MSPFLLKVVAFTVVFIAHPCDYPVMVHKKRQSSSAHKGMPWQLACGVFQQTAKESTRLEPMASIRWAISIL